MADSKSQNVEQMKKLFVHSFPIESTEEELKQFFSQYGEVEEFIVIRDKITKKSKRFGFCKFASVEGIDNVQSQRPINFKDAILDTRRAAPKGMEHDSITKQKINRLYVSGIREDIESEDLNAYFSNHGKIVKIDVMVSQETGKKRGFGFIEFDDFDTVDKMCLMRSHMIKNYRCDVKKAIPKESMTKGPGQRSDNGNRSYNNNGGRDRSFNNSGYGNREQYAPRPSYDQYNQGRQEYAPAPYEQQPAYAPDAYSNRYQYRGPANPPQYDNDANGYDEYAQAQPQRHNPYKRY
ncbi:Heterogeneous nuclear ribonucleoprotein A0 [Intoshia linei]|uniref:Heterogeneous nuclear ribonucleoprotein A0 n=1 Tax=Intoshia linei TaxID=1819745 RepID=A0A177B055_9BILA|nr:Heterogeneous nuclear ribonucleoprotein A0 [Intoshia linei]